jgi:hypothetical protein
MNHLSGKLAQAELPLTGEDEGWAKKMQKKQLFAREE